MKRERKGEKIKKARIAQTINIYKQIHIREHVQSVIAYQRCYQRAAAAARRVALCIVLVPTAALAPCFPPITKSTYKITG